MLCEWKKREKFLLPGRVQEDVAVSEMNVKRITAGRRGQKEWVRRGLAGRLPKGMGGG